MRRQEWEGENSHTNRQMPPLVSNRISAVEGELRNVGPHCCARGNSGEAFTPFSLRARTSFSFYVAPAADRGAKRGLKLPLSFLSWSLDYQAAPPASYTVDDADSSSYSLLLLAQAHLSSCLLPDGASTSLGCRAEKFPATLKSPARALRIKQK